jgi:hypothetical protein
LQLNAGFVIFPDEGNRVRERANVSADTEVTGSALSILMGMGVGLMIYP